MTHPTAFAPCRHCRRLTRRHARGLCQTCYRDPHVRGRFAALRPTRKRRTATAAMDPETARGPTHHPPGSPGKIAVLAARWAAGLPLFHPGDAAG
jgi:hypothetical protein